MRGACVGPLGERRTVQAHSQTCPGKDAPAGRRRCRVWYKKLQPPLELLCFSLKSDCANEGWGLEDDIIPPSHPWGGEPGAAAVQEALTEKGIVSPPVS